ncbi:hypothetical protein LCGC14_2443380 [marine sediment metagenome]|uniref:Uncharacterized protein n=1 Tax=marine sediment metagenome TaxID=412755 RepID=A0A0F9EC95_9ZZZZ
MAVSHWDMAEGNGEGFVPDIECISAEKCADVCLEWAFMKHGPGTQEQRKRFLEWRKRQVANPHHSDPDQPQSQ